MNLIRDVLIIEAESTPHYPQFQEIPRVVRCNLSTVNETIQVLLIPLHRCLYLSKSRYWSKRIEHSMGNRDASMSWLNHFCDWIVLLWSYRVFHWTTVEVAWNLSTDLSLTLLFSLLINYATSTLDSCNLVYILPYLHIYSSQWYHYYHHYSPSTSEHNSHLSQN